MQAKGRITSKGQITIPREIRQRLGVGPGDEVVFVEDRDGIHLRRFIPDSAFAKWSGYLKEYAGRSSDELVAEMRVR